MAGMGKRMRPHTLTIPKPLIPVAGKPIVEHLVEDIIKVCHEPVDEIAFVVGRFGQEVEKSLIAIAEKQGAKGTICYQDEPLGTAHAILCAGEALTGNLVIAFADTLFKTDQLKLNRVYQNFEVLVLARSRTAAKSGIKPEYQNTKDTVKYVEIANTSHTSGELKFTQRDPNWFGNGNGQ